ncbi:hypothetical protein J4408_00835 [Candidatus Pacearchaeota archaeon]|nr:hypothetical protein [Candidatus Pacearchaeota archaeon]
MAITKWYRTDAKGRAPVVLGLPGFVQEDEDTRIDYFLREFKEKHNINGMRLTWPNITFDQERKTIECRFKMDEYLTTLQEAIKELKADQHVDSDIVGVLASSMSASVFAYHLASENTNFKCYTSICPMIGWNYFGNPPLRSNLERNPRNIPVSNYYDKQKGITRYIPASYLDQIIEVDALEALKDYNKNGMNVMTIIGKQDDVSNPESMRQYHKFLGGSEANILEYDAGHDVNPNLCEDPIIRFFTSSLKKDFDPSILLKAG